MSAHATSGQSAASPAPVVVEAADDLADWPTGRLLSTAARLVEGAWAARLAEQGLTHAGLMALHELGQSQPLPVLELASRCQVTPQTMTRTLDRLERDGLVRRDRASGDRRRLDVTRTEHGAGVYARAADMSDAEPVLLGDVVDLPELRRHLIAIVEHLNPSHPVDAGVPSQG
jgi:DNA-binding MarR family transcriptional regulator